MEDGGGPEWGPPSDRLRCGEIHGLPVVFLPPPWQGYYSPTSINYRANVDVMKRMGVTDIVSLSAVGSLKEDLRPGMFVLVDQFIDRTFAREKSSSGTACVGHGAIFHPISSGVAGSASQRPLRRETGPSPAAGPTQSWKVCSSRILGPNLLDRSWSVSVIGMTNLPEVKPAGVAETVMTVAMVTGHRLLA